MLIKYFKILFGEREWEEGLWHLSYIVTPRMLGRHFCGAICEPFVEICEPELL